MFKGVKIDKLFKKKNVKISEIGANVSSSGIFWILANNNNMPFSIHFVYIFYTYFAHLSLTELDLYLLELFGCLLQRIRVNYY